MGVNSMSTPSHHPLQGTPELDIKPIPGIQVTEASDTTPLLAAIANTFIGVDEDTFFASVTSADYEQLIATLDALIDVVGEDKNHLLAPLMEFIGNLVEKCQVVYGEDEPKYTPDMLISLNPDAEEPNAKWSTGAPSGAHGLEAAYGENEPEYTPDMLIAINPEYEPA